MRLVSGRLSSLLARGVGMTTDATVWGPDEMPGAWEVGA